jgi:hypothetical protein
MPCPNVAVISFARKNPKYYRRLSFDQRILGSVVRRGIISVPTGIAFITERFWLQEKLVKKWTTFWLFYLSVLFCSVASAQEYKADSIVSSCAHWGSVKLDKHKQFKGSSEDLYQTGVCVGYFEGLIDGLNDSGGWGKEGNLVFHIDTKSISSTWDVITAFYGYIRANPLEKGRPAWQVLQVVLVSNHLAEFVPSQRQQNLASDTVH